MNIAVCLKQVPKKDSILRIGADQKWIDENITPKLEGRSGQEIAEAQQSVKGTRKVAGKRRR